MLKKASDDAKKRIVFFIDFSSIFREKSTGNHAKSMENSFVRKNRRQARSERRFLAKNRFLAIFWLPLGPQGPLGTSRELPKSLMSLIHCQFRLQTSPDGLQEASGRPRRSPQAPPGYDFASIFGSILHVKNKRKHTKGVENNSKNLDELVTLIRATVNS